MKRKYRRATLLGLAAEVVIILAICLPSGRSEASPQKTSDKGYSTDMKELRDKFNKDKGNVRLLLLLSPTRPECLRGASEIQSKVLEKIKGSDVRVYAVYLPILKMDRQGNVPSAMNPPAPDYWMAQLSGISSERRRDGNKFADETSKLLRINRQ